MNEKQFDRRKFLQAVGAAAALVGLSHFRFLNIDIPVALASPADNCTPPAIPDYCNPGKDPDVCPDNNATSSDVCLPQFGEADVCEPGMVPPEPDVCDPSDKYHEPDNCTPEPTDPDECEVPPGGPDRCEPQANPDICPDGPTGDGDICSPTNPNADPDECIPAVGESDKCLQAEPDFCRDPGTGLVSSDRCDPNVNDSDICIENGQNTIDICDPGAGNPDEDPNAVALSSFTGKSGRGAAPVILGGLAVAAGAAAFGRRAKRSRAGGQEESPPLL